MVRQTAAARVKFCGLTCLEDALAAVELGADMLGFNFYPQSSRCLSPDACARLIGELASVLDRPSGRVQTVGIFVNHDPGRVLSIMQACGLDAAQLSGDEPASDLKRIGSRAYKALRLSGDIDIPATARPYLSETMAPAFLLDAAVPGQYGGTGQLGDWAAASQVALSYPILLAGGLNPGNARAAILEVRPWGVDVASGIESRPGRKDYRRMAAFIAAVREAEDEIR